MPAVLNDMGLLLRTFIREKWTKHVSVLTRSLLPNRTPLTWPPLVVLIWGRACVSYKLCPSLLLLIFSIIDEGIRESWLLASLGRWRPSWYEVRDFFVLCQINTYKCCVGLSLRQPVWFGSWKLKCTLLMGVVSTVSMPGGCMAEMTDVYLLL